MFPIDSFGWISWLLVYRDLGLRVHVKRGMIRNSIWQKEWESMHYLVVLLVPRLFELSWKSVESIIEEILRCRSHETAELIDGWSDFTFDKAWKFYLTIFLWASGTCIWFYTNSISAFNSLFRMWKLWYEANLLRRWAIPVMFNLDLPS